MKSGSDCFEGDAAGFVVHALQARALFVWRPVGGAGGGVVKLAAGDGVTVGEIDAHHVLVVCGGAFGSITDRCTHAHGEAVDCLDLPFRK